ncbi:MAG: transglutaminase domain-containing protein [Lachnospiraceae bacterium]
MRIQCAVKKGLVVLLTAIMLLSGCGNTGANDKPLEETITAEGNSSGETVSSAGDVTAAADSAAETNTDLELIEELKQKYAANGAAEYDGNVIEINRDAAIQFPIGYNPWEKEEHIYESFVVYQDDKLQFPLDVGVHEYDAETGMLTINPPYYGIAEMDDYEADLSHLSGNYLMAEEGNAWGTLPQYYLAAYVDVNTGEPLETPLITVIKVSPEIKTAPQLAFDQTEDGFARFSWNEVPGADGYLLFLINKDETGLWENAKVFADVAGTEWTSEAEAFEYEGEILTLNERFVQYYISDDTESWMDAAGVDWGTGEDIAYDEYYSEYFGMIAYNAQGCSAISNLLSAKDISHMLPTEQANFTNEDSFYDIHATLDLPAVMCVTMCDGTTAQRVLDYDVENLRKDEENNSYYITARAIQTPFTTEFLVYGHDWDTLDADLAALEERQEKLQNKGGNVAPTLSVDEETEDTPAPDVEEPAPEVSEPTSDVTRTQITANSAMSEYVAMQMLSTNEAIDLSAFPEAADTQKIKDAFFEAQYQNPLILGVQGGSIDTEKRILYVNYDFDRDTTASKQQEIEGRVERIVSEIITADMTDLEKEMAINDYLCEHARYDDAALENAQKYNFATVDVDFYDSFTAYGVLVDGVGVCASYSAAFKLLADAAGLESIVVTGYLDGSVPHAWNKVKIEDNWYIVDATNNDNELIENALLNLSDSAAYGTLVENDSFVLDDSLYNYVAEEDNLEYYHATNRYYEQEEISGELAALLVSEGKAVLRTSYDIDDEVFYEIATNAANTAGKRVRGFYWMGVIHLEE